MDAIWTAAWIGGRGLGDFLVIILLAIVEERWNVETLTRDMRRAIHELLYRLMNE